MRNRYVLLVLIILWAFPSIVVKYLNSQITPTTQNFFRFLSAGLFLLVFSFFYDKKEFFSGLKNSKFFILPAGILVFAQMFAVYGIILGQANISSFISKTDAFFSILFAYFLIKGERLAIRQASFVTGAILSFFGIALMILSESSSIFNLSLLFLLCAAFLAGIYSVIIKKLLLKTNISENVAGALVFSIVSLLYLPLSWGNLNEIFRVSAFTNVVLFGSGVLFIGIAGGLFYYLLKNIGVVITMNALLVVPFFTLIFSYLLLGEKITLMQFIAGVLLIGGFWFIIKSEKKLR